MKIDILDSFYSSTGLIHFFNEAKLLMSRDLIFWYPVSNKDLNYIQKKTLITYEY